MRRSLAPLTRGAPMRQTPAPMHLTLTQARARRHLSVAQLAARSGVHKATVARIERGAVQPMHKTVAALEAALALRPGTLVVEYGGDEPHGQAA